MYIIVYICIFIHLFFIVKCFPPPPIPISSSWSLRSTVVPSDSVTLLVVVDSSLYLSSSMVVSMHCSWSSSSRTPRCSNPPCPKAIYRPKPRPIDHHCPSLMWLEREKEGEKVVERGDEAMNQGGKKREWERRRERRRRRNVRNFGKKWEN